MSTIKIEFAVKMTCNSCVEAVEKCLSNAPDIKIIDISLEKGTVVVETSLPTLQVQTKIESTGRKVVVKGYAGSSAGVAILDTGKTDTQGVIRFVQAAPNSCIIDGTVDGLEPNLLHRLTVHECGDLSQGCDGVGDVYNSNSNRKGIYGDLGTIKSEEDGRLSFRWENSEIKLPEIIGRSLVLSRVVKNDQNRIICGVIARSAGLFQNPKTICACDGTTIWNEKIPPKSVM